MPNNFLNGSYYAFCGLMLHKLLRSIVRGPKLEINVHLPVGSETSKSQPGNCASFLRGFQMLHLLTSSVGEVQLAISFGLLYLLSTKYVSVPTFSRTVCT